MPKISRHIKIPLTVSGVFLFLMLMVAFLIQAERDRAAESSRFMALQQLTTISARLEGLLNANLIAMRGLQAEFLIAEEVHNDRFARLSAKLLDQNLHTMHVAVAPNLVISHVYPLEHNESIIGTDFRNVPDQYPSVSQAMQKGQIVINGPLDLMQGGNALIARIPVIRNDGSEWGIISQVIDYRRLLQDAGFNQVNNLRLALRRYDEQVESSITIAGSQEVWQQDHLIVDLDLPSGIWELAATPASGQWVGGHSDYSIAWLSGFIVAVVLSWLVASLLQSHHRLAKAFATISHQARFDPLTQLVNRSYFRQLLDAHIASCKRREDSFAMLFIDLDHFKEINDSLGHDAGDQLLQRIAEVLIGNIRADDLVARLGGDEFVVLLKDIEHPATAELLATKLLDDLMQPLQLKDQQVTIEASIGIAMFPQDGRYAADLLKHADLAMYASKQAGRGTISFFSEQMQEQANNNLTLHKAMQEGLQQQQFFLVYQPIIAARSGECRYVEALMRWQHPERGLISPAEFIPVAERSGLIRQLGDFALEQSCRDLGWFQQQGLSLHISVNCSSKDFHDEKVVKQWLDIIHKHGQQPGSLTMEITESVLMPDRERQHHILRRLHEAGISFAIDDFGTGYSSVNYLRQFPIQTLKIDRCLIDELTMVAALVQMARAMNLITIAEGVETETQAQQLRALGVDYLQGFFFSKPLLREDMITFMHAREKNGVSH